jgi:hypothetical protein
MRCQSAGEMGCFDVSAGFSFPHLYRSPDFDGRPRFAPMMHFPCPSSCPYSPICPINARKPRPQDIVAAHERTSLETLHEYPLANVAIMNCFV